MSEAALAVDVKKVSLTKCQVGAMSRFTRDEWDNLRKSFPGVAENVLIERQDDVATGELLYTLRSYLLQLSGPYPTKQRTFQWKTCRTWWDHFKRDLMPMWFTDLFPVKYITSTHYCPEAPRLCPHSDIEWPGGEHIQFLTYEGRLPCFTRD